jgi:4-hydroxymandelate oxidase
LRPGQSEVFDGWMADAPGWDDLVWLRARTPVPLLIKGVLHAADAARAVDLGCDGVVVSNHGGRVLDCAPPALSCLTEVIAAVGDRVPVLFDSGIDSGADALRALSLGARAVMVGRPYLWGLAAGGALGVAHVIRLLRDELEMCMALCGCATLADVSADRCD